MEKDGEWRMVVVDVGAGLVPAPRGVDAGMWGYGTQLRRSMLRLLFGRG
jgi:hypothetical protein